MSRWVFSRSGSPFKHSHISCQLIVKDSNDEPLSDVSVEITTHNSTCEEPGVNHGVVKTDNDGTFLKVIIRSEEETVNCLTLRTSSKINRELKDSTINRSADLDFKLSEPFDHETVNISY